MKIRKKLTLLLILLPVFALVSCGVSEDTQSESGFFLYYLNDGLDQLVTETYTLQAGSTEDQIGETLEQQMVVPVVPADEELNALLPEDVEVLDYTLDGTTLTLNFSGAYDAIPAGREVLARGGMVRELLQISGVESLVFTVDGSPLLDSYGNEIGSMTGESFVENSAQTVNAYQSAAMTLYFADASGTRLVPESRKAYYISSEPLERAVVEEIIKGPEQDGHYAVYSSDSSILSVITQDGICYVNFGENVLSSAPSVTEEVQIYSIVNSLADTCGVREVRFSIEGDSSSRFREEMSMNQEYEKNESLISEE